MESEIAKKTYIVAGCRPWNRRLFDDVLSTLPGRWIFLDDRNALTLDYLAELSPRYVFFLHWSYLVPLQIVESYECVCFHMTDVPYGRGGSPLQNLIMRGHHSTKLTALKMVKELDAGPVYFKKALSLEGSAEEIYIRASHLSAEMIKVIVNEQPVPVPQAGEIVIFKRRKPSQSQVPPCRSLLALYDHLRMLDAEGYPHAFIEHEGFRYEFSRSVLYDGRIQADVTITPLNEVSS